MLNSEKIDYLVVGGYAVGYYGYPRATGDLDIWVSATRENAERLARVLISFGFSAASVSPELFLKEKQIVRMGMPPLRIELLTHISGGLSFHDCYERRKLDVVNGVDVSFLSLSDLKHNKTAAGGAKDVNDLENLP